jgi:hypothetical protein
MFEIGSMNLDQYLDTSKYSVQSKDEYGDAWYDGWYNKHQDIVRSRIMGEVVLLFKNISDFHSFVANFDSARDSSGKCRVRLYVDTDGASTTIDAFVTYETKTVFTTPAFGQLPKIFQVTLTIEEQ